MVNVQLTKKKNRKEKKGAKYDSVVSAELMPTYASAGNVGKYAKGSKMVLCKYHLDKTLYAFFYRYYFKPTYLLELSF